MSEPSSTQIHAQGKPSFVFFRRTHSPGSRGLYPREIEPIVAAMVKVGVASESICRAAARDATLQRSAGHARDVLGPRVRGPRAMVAAIALAARADGIALGKTVYLRPELLREDGGAPLDLLAHEITHVAQYLRDGMLGFYAKYVGAYLRGLAAGLGDRGAYLAIPYEVEARAVARALVASDYSRI